MFKNINIYLKTYSQYFKYLKIKIQSLVMVKNVSIAFQTSYSIILLSENA